MSIQIDEDKNDNNDEGNNEENQKIIYLKKKN